MANKQLILFKVASEIFAVEISLVKEIVPFQNITPVPDAYNFVEGIINLRGKIVTIIDMRKRLHTQIAESKEKTSRIIILEIDDKLMGMLVDAASEIIRVDDKAIGPAPELISGQGNNYIIGVIKHNDRLIVMLDLKKILSSQEIGKLDDLVKSLYGQTT
ncbi:MAG: purine-binding chemotaxis protein CheW [Blastocatellia bacterium]|nr:purine-binding chemotaxis protein CheW [Blastocatellia bacterium]MBL8195527.1 purine-binding chemotaxis protein CheW [Blastocatellia bacterium]MBN8722936.1 purine-binding chemotaxis protein CheW [Acidobacteriota bacterium]